MHSRTIAILVFCSVFVQLSAAQVKTGADLLFEKYIRLIDGKNVGLVTNHSALLSNGQHLADTLSKTSCKLVALFGPEHGIRGDAPDGKNLTHGTDAKTGVPVYSLYGSINKPTPEMLKDVEVLLFDIQDVGVRFYTYISTLSYAMEAAAENNIPFILLDRPNPIRGVHVDGFIREDSLRSFVGLHPIPIAHGMTVGELAMLFNEEGWLKNGIKASLTVVKMEGWKRSMWYDQTGLRWIKPSPNMATLATAIVYPGTCLIEGTNLSEGRGTQKPFEYIGAPFIDGKKWAEVLNRQKLPGVKFEPIEFTPHSIAGVTVHPKYDSLKCYGIQVKVVNRNQYKPVQTGVFILSTVKQLFADSLRWRERSIDRLSGTPNLRRMIDAGKPAKEIVGAWGEEVEKFRIVRKKYLLYK
ncbi:MAG: DUF1343 domain-containing protein [bacterium]